MTDSCPVCQEDLIAPYTGTARVAPNGQRFSPDNYSGCRNGHLARLTDPLQNPHVWIDASDDVADPEEADF